MQTKTSHLLELFEIKGNELREPYSNIAQADISRIENGIANPSLRTLQRLADGIGMKLKLEFVPVNR